MATNNAHGRPTRSQTLNRRKDTGEYRLANSRVVVTTAPVGYAARIERLDKTEYGILAPGTVDALETVARGEVDG